MTTPSLRALRAPATRPAPGAETVVLALLGRRPGDNAQVRALAAASGLPWTEMRLGLRKGFEALPNLRRGGSLFSFDCETQSVLRAARPSVVIAAGKRSAPAALWLKSRTGARLVHLGRTWCPPDWFDLVITTPQYDQPGGANVIRNLFPLTPPAQHIDCPADLAELPRPILLVVAGGPAPGLAFGVREARGLAAVALARRAEAGGSLLVATSPRSPARMVEALRGALGGAEAPVLMSVFGDGPNRYREFLAAADSVIVTSDSVSMVADAAAAGLPAEIFFLQGGAPQASARVKIWDNVPKIMTRFASEHGLVASRHDLTAYMAGLRRDSILADGRAARVIADELREAAGHVTRLAGAGAT